ncbi:MAG: hypothetical protein WBD87_05960 [Candidatus Acidiferrales bacterium]
MSVHDSQLARLRSFGYTEAEARFLYLVAVHSGYFTVRQFLDFAHAKSGKRNARFVEKLFRFGHATAQRYTRRSLVYHLCSRRIYEAIGKAHLRNRREHELDYIKTRLLALDFILANPEDRYFETAEEKRRYLIERFKLSESLFSPSGEHGKAITFSEGFPLCVAYPAPDYMPVVTFTYVDPEHRNLDRYVRHLRTYRPLFRQLPGFQFIYISTAAGLRQEAGELFSLLVGGKGLSDLARYFDIQTKWDNKKYGLVTEGDRSSETRLPSVSAARYLTLSSVCGSESSCRMTCGRKRKQTERPRKKSCSKLSPCRARKRYSGKAARDGVTAGKSAVLQV